MFDSWENPFIYRDKILSIASGVEATVDIEHDCLDAEKNREVVCNDFLQNRLKSKNTPFHETIKKSKLKSFKDLNNKEV